MYFYIGIINTHIGIQAHQVVGLSSSICLVDIYSYCISDCPPVLLIKLGKSSMNKFQNKLVAVLNEKIDSGKLMNSLSHMCIGFGAKLGKNNLQLMDYQDADGGSHPNISAMPFIVLKANSNKIRKLREDAIKSEILYTDFTDTMTIGTYEEQIQRSLQTKEEELIYYGIVLFGDWEKLTELTRKFSLWR